MLIKVYLELLTQVHFYLMRFLKCLSVYKQNIKSTAGKKVTPVGGTRDIEINVRIVATTNRDMVEEVKNNKFRQDLYYRLNVFYQNH